MADKIPLTIALLTYNRGGTYLREAIQGILAQTYRNFEFLILDNGSTDETPHVVLSYKDDRIRYIRNSPGLSAYFNGASAVKIARGERLLITFDDDIMLPNMLERQMQLMDSDPGIIGVWTNLKIINKDGTTIQDYWHPPGEEQIHERGAFLADFLFHQVWPFPCTLMFRQDHRKNPGVDYNYYGGTRPKGMQNIHGGDDILTLIGLNAKGKIAFINEPLFKYRRHSQQDTYSTDPSLDVFNAYRKIKKTIRTQKFISNDTRSAVDAFAVHYEVQHLIATVPEKTPPSQVIRKISTLFDKKVALEPAPQYQLLSTAILLSHYGKDACKRLLDRLQPPEPKYSTATRILYSWAQARLRQENWLASIPKESNIAILGSVFIASLLLNEAREHGLHVVCCLESNKKRQHMALLGIPIMPTEDLASHTGIDYVILSSEKNQEPYLKNLILDLNRKVKVISWKELCP